jgi:hypothetical protein
LDQIIHILKSELKLILLFDIIYVEHDATHKGDYMLHLMQIYKLIDNKDLFIELFNDLSFELDELGYSNFPEMLINEMLDNHFGIYLECDKQLQRITETIIKKQGSLHFLKMI